MIKIRLTGYWDECDIILNSLLNKFNNGMFTFKNVLFVRDNSYDRLVILTKPHINFGEYDVKKAVTLMTEPPIEPYINSHPTSYICPMYLPLPSIPKIIFGMKKYGGNGLKLVKNKLLSTITSDLNSLDGHKKRLHFIYVLDKMLDVGFDCWGKNNNNKFFEMISNYKGYIADKFEGLWGYHYHFACENHFIQDYFTEKIFDPIIAECLCFYSGCTNIYEYIDERAFVYLDMNNVETSLEKMIREINNNERQKRVKFIRAQKLRLLTTLNPLNIIYMLVNEYDVQQKCKL